MARYLHLFDTTQDFESVYNNEGEEQTIATFQCSVGTFYFYDGRPGNYAWIDTPDAASATKMLMTFGPNPNVGIMTAESYQALMAHAQEMMESGATEEAIEYVSANFLGAVDDSSDELVEITSVGSITTQVYHEPWVSYTEGDEKVHYNKMQLTPEQAYAFGNYVKVTMNWCGEEEPYTDSWGSGYHYLKMARATLQFGRNFDNSTNSVFVTSGEIFTRQMLFFTRSGQTFNLNTPPNVGGGSFDNDSYEYETEVYYAQQGGYTDITYTPSFCEAGHGYECRWDTTNSRWYCFPYHS